MANHAALHLDSCGCYFHIVVCVSYIKLLCLSPVHYFRVRGRDSGRGWFPWNSGTGRGAAKKGKDMIKTFAVLSMIMSFTLLLQVPCQLALEIMRCYNSLSSTSFTMSIVFDCRSHRAMPLKICSLCLPLALFLSIFAVVTRYFAFSLHAQ